MAAAPPTSSSSEVVGGEEQEEEEEADNDDEDDEEEEEEIVIDSFSKAKEALARLADGISKNFMPPPNGSGGCWARNGIRAIGVHKLLASTHVLEPEQDIKVTCFEDGETIRMLRYCRISAPAAATTVANATALTDNISKLHDSIITAFGALQGLPFSILDREYIIGSLDVREAAEARRCIMGVIDLLLWDCEEKCIVIGDLKTLTNEHWSKNLPFSYRFLKRLHVLQLHLYAHLLEKASGGFLRAGYALLIGYDPYDNERHGAVGVWRVQLQPNEQMLYANPCAHLEDSTQSPYYIRYTTGAQAQGKRRVCVSSNWCDTNVYGTPDHVLPRKPLLAVPPAPPRNRAGADKTKTTTISVNGE